jgi:hypothetical protein
MKTTELPSFVLRVAQNLEQQELHVLLMLTSIVLENARQFFASLGQGGKLTQEIDAIYRPFVDELMRRSAELEAPKPVTRKEGNA